MSTALDRLGQDLVDWGMLTLVNRKRGDDPLPAALAVLRRDGPAGLTMRNVAAEAGVTATALYRHYADKESLLRAVVRETYGVFRDAMGAEVPSGDSHIWLRLGFDRFLRFGLEHPNYYRLLFAESHGVGIDRYPDDFVNGKSGGFRQLRDLVAACMTQGSLHGEPATDAPDVALTLYAHMHGLVMLHLAGRFPDQRVFQRFYMESMERVIAGMG
jgi:AcrR family transcriptional regulator